MSVHNPVTGIVETYQVVVAGETAEPLGTTGAAGDYLSHVNIHPATVGAGTVIVYDGVVAVETFTAGTLSDLRTITIPVGTFSKTGAWNVTTGANVSVTAYGSFT